MKEPKILNEEGKEYASKYVRYAATVALNWCKKNNFYPWKDDFIATAYLTLVKAVVTCKNREHFTAYLVKALSRSFIEMAFFISYSVRKKGPEGQFSFISMVDKDIDMEKQMEFLPFNQDEEIRKEEFLLDFDTLLNLSNKLKDKEKDILKDVYEFDKSFAEIGRKLGISREAIRQKHDKAVDKLRVVLKKNKFKEEANESKN